VAHLSRPFQIALVAFGLLVAVWFFALRGNSSTSSPGSAATVPAPTPAPSASAQAQQAAAPTSVYHGPAPGVGGLTRALAKAHGAVATSQQNAKQLEQKSAQASSSASPAPSASPTGGQAAPSSTPGTAAVTPAPHGKAVKSTTTPATPAAGSSTRSEARSGPNRTPARQALVERALKEGKIAVVLFWNPKGADDVAVRNELRLLEAVHHLIRPFAGVPAVRQRLTRSGLELDKKFAAFVASAKQVTSFGTITRGVQVYGTPTLLVINKRGQVTTLTGLTDAYSIEQAIDEARHS
jgi:hypothetical protein